MDDSQDMGKTPGRSSRACGFTGKVTEKTLKYQHEHNYANGSLRSQSQIKREVPRRCGRTGWKQKNTHKLPAKGHRVREIMTDWRDRQCTPMYRHSAADDVLRVRCRLKADNGYARADTRGNIFWPAEAGLRRPTGPATRFDR